jgi:hypothetical protein
MNEKDYIEIKLMLAAIERFRGTESFEPYQNVARRMWRIINKKEPKLTREQLIKWGVEELLKFGFAVDISRFESNPKRNPDD